MDCIEAILTRRSIRKFTDEEVDQSILETILEAGRMAPSAGNLQPTYFVVVKNSEMKQKLQAAAFGQYCIGSCSVVIAVCADPERSSQYGEIGRTKWCLLDCANATQNMLLAAHANGYGACWVGGFNEKEVQKLLGLPERFRVVSLIPIGKPAENPDVPERRPLQDIVRWEKW
jgi:nitroreductase